MIEYEQVRTWMSASYAPGVPWGASYAPGVPGGPPRVAARHKLGDRSAWVGIEGTYDRHQLAEVIRTLQSVERSLAGGPAPDQP